MTLIELVAAAGLISAVSAMSFFQIKSFQKKALQKEAKINLSQFYQGQVSYKFDNGNYADEIENIIFPKGALRYNVGFKIGLTARNDSPPNPITSGINNFWELCHIEKDIPRKEISINGATNIITKGDCFFRIKDDTAGFPPPSIKDTAATVKNNTDPKEFKAFAIGNLEEDNNDSCKEAVGSDLEDKIDEWTMNHEAQLTNTRGPFAVSSIPDGDASTVCGNKI